MKSRNHLYVKQYRSLARNHSLLNMYFQPIQTSLHTYKHIREDKEGVTLWYFLMRVFN